MVALGGNVKNRVMTTTKADRGLLRLLGTGSATALVISNMIGATIFGAPGLMLGALGSPCLVILAWAAGAVFAFAGALSYAELGINFPSSGGEFVYLTRAYGKPWGFMTGWVSFFAGFSAPIAASALIFAHYVARVFPQIGRFSVAIGPAQYNIHFGTEQVLAGGLIASSTLVNIFGIRRASGMQNILTTAKVALIVALIGGGVLVGTGQIAYLGQTVSRVSDRPAGFEFLIQLLWVMAAYSGWNAATYVAEELRQPERTLPRALALGTATVAILYLGLNFVFFYSTPPSGLRNVIAVGQVAATNLFGSGVAVVFSALMAISVMATVNAMATVGPRVYYAMALNGLFPKTAAKLHPTWRTPVAAILSQGVCAALLTVTPIPDLFSYIGFSLTIFSVLAVASVFVFRRNAGWQRLPALDRLYPLVPASYVAVGSAMIIWGILFAPVVSIAALVTIGAGVVAYRFATRG
jgi:APA family basic amino acid/polyamine antiporter